MGEILVQYNGNNLFPTPLVNQNIQFIDYGSRWGNVVGLELNGVLTGVSSTGIVNSLTSIFGSQFQTLNVFESGSGLNLIYTWPNVIVDEITFPNSHYYNGTIINYSVRLRSFNVPSGVVDPTNEYSFTQNEDGTVTVNHRISARGIRTSSKALDNAISFVRLFTGKDSFTGCTPLFIPNGRGVLLGQSENIDRLNGQYSINEIYKYNTGVLQNLHYVTTSSLEISDNLDDEYTTLDYQIRFQGSPVQNNITTLNSVIPTVNIFQNVSNFGIQTGLLAQFNMEVTRNSGECYVELKSSFVSGYSQQDLTGFFNYDVGFSKDLITPRESWRIDGDFICRGPVSYKKQKLDAFKTAHSSDWRGYLEGLISGSPIYTYFHTSGNYLNTNPILDIQENTGIASFHATLSIEDGGEPNGLSNPKYSIEVEPSKWLFELLPAANIEGHYVVQDLQMKTQSKVKFNLSSESQYPSVYLGTLSGNLSGLEAIYIQTGFIINDSYETGLLDMSASRQWIGADRFSTGILFTKVVGSNTFNYTRGSGFKFGY